MHHASVRICGVQSHRMEMLYGIGKVQILNLGYAGAGEGKGRQERERGRREL